MLWSLGVKVDHVCIGEVGPCQVLVECFACGSGSGSSGLACLTHPACSPPRCSAAAAVFGAAQRICEGSPGHR